MKIDKLSKKYQEVFSALIMKFPFIAPIITELDVIETEEIPTAGVTNDGVLLINPNIPEGELFFTLAHELLHYILLHPERGKGKDPFIWNLATDAVVNRILELERVNFDRSKYVTFSYLESLAEEVFLTNKTEEEIYNIIKEKIENKVIMPKYVVINGKRYIFYGELGIDERSGNYDMEKKLQKLRGIGNIPDNIRRYIDHLLNPEINWVLLIKRTINNSISELFVNTYKRQSRKFHSKDLVFPGETTISTPRGFIIVDTSGSITEEQLRRAISEILGISRISKDLRVIYFDADIQGVEIVRKPSDVKKLTPRGGGGTVIRKALEYVKKNMRFGDFVVIFSDGYISDLEECQGILKEIAEKSSSAIFVLSSIAKIKLPSKWVIIRENTY